MHTKETPRKHPSLSHHAKMGKKFRTRALIIIGALTLLLAILGIQYASSL